MQNFTIGEIGSVIIWIMSVIVALEFIIIRIKRLLLPIRQEIRRNELMHYFSILRREGILDNNEKVHLHTTYKDYIDNKGNGYIEHEYKYWEKEGKI